MGQLSCGIHGVKTGRLSHKGRRHSDNRVLPDNFPNFKADLSAISDPTISD